MSPVTPSDTISRAVLLFFPRRRRFLSFVLLIVTSCTLFLYLDNRLLFLLRATTVTLFGPIPSLALPPYPDHPTAFLYPPNSSNSYLLFAPTDVAPADTSIRRMASHDAISDECLQEWVGKGEWAGECLGLRLEEPKVDLVWTWVNGSDPLHHAARKAHPLPSASRLAALADAVQRAKQYRQHDELRFSLRSANVATKSWKQSTFHLVTNSYSLPSPPYEAKGKEYVMRLGQVPQWLNLKKVGEEVPKFVIHHDVNLFHLLPSPLNHEVPDAELAAWREASLPTFNSLAVESQLANLPPSKVSENTVFLMDDNYFLLPVSTSAFYSPIHGPVLHFQPDRLIYPPPATRHPPPGLTEWRGLETAASRLSERFGARGRPYLVHNARVIPLPLLHEASLAFPSAFSDTATSRFRGQDASRPEAHTLWLATHFIVERHREALLWSWVVGKWGNRKGTITRQEKEKMWLELGGDAEGGVEKKEDLIEVPWPKRDSRLRIKEEMEKTGLPDSGTTNYAFVSSDGYPFTYLPLRNSFPLPPDQNGWPDLASSVSPSPEGEMACKIIRADCFNDGASEPAAEMLRRIMVDKPTCGDCVISALIASSGSSGFSVFLPLSTSPSFSSSSNPPPSSPPLHLPLSLSSLLAFPIPSSINLHLFALRLIQRYSYVVGATPTHFFGATGAANAKQRLAVTDQVLTNTVLLCVNDDLMSTDQRMVKALDGVLGEWMRGRWPDRLEIERTEEVGVDVGG